MLSSGEQKKTFEKSNTQVQAFYIPTKKPTKTKVPLRLLADCLSETESFVEPNSSERMAGAQRKVAFKLPISRFWLPMGRFSVVLRSSCSIANISRSGFHTDSRFFLFETLKRRSSFSYGSSECSRKRNTQAFVVRDAAAARQCLNHLKVANDKIPCAHGGPRCYFRKPRKMWLQTNCRSRIQVLTFLSKAFSFPPSWVQDIPRIAKIFPPFW